VPEVFSVPTAGRRGINAFFVPRSMLHGKRHTFLNQQRPKPFKRKRKREKESYASIPNHPPLRPTISSVKKKKKGGEGEGVLGGLCPPLLANCEGKEEGRGGGKQVSRSPRPVSRIIGGCQVLSAKANRATPHLKRSGRGKTAGVSPSSETGAKVLPQSGVQGKRS